MAKAESTGGFDENSIQANGKQLRETPFLPVQSIQRVKKTKSLKTFSNEPYESNLVREKNMISEANNKLMGQLSLSRL